MTVLVVRLDSAGDVLLSGPAVRAIASSDRVVMLCGPLGEAAARLLPGVDDVIVWRCPWIDPQPPPVNRDDIERIVADIAAVGASEAVVLTSYHQSPLPSALLLRLAGVPRISAVSEDYPGALLDVRHQLPESGLHEVERMLSVAAAAGFRLKDGDDGRLAVRRPLPDPAPLVRAAKPYAVIHPGASVPARAWSPQHHAELVRLLTDDGVGVVVTGAPGERALTAYVAGDDGLDLGGRTTLAQLAGLLDGADVVVTGNTGPAHLAAAVGTPVVSLFAPTVPAERWRPWHVPHVLLGDQQAACAGSRARECPMPGHPCLNSVMPRGVAAAVRNLMPARPLEGVPS